MSLKLGARKGKVVLTVLQWYANKKHHPPSKQHTQPQLGPGYQLQHKEQGCLQPPKGLLWDYHNPRLGIET